MMVFSETCMQDLNEYKHESVPKNREYSMNDFPFLIFLFINQHVINLFTTNVIYEYILCLNESINLSNILIVEIYSKSFFL